MLAEGAVDLDGNQITAESVRQVIAYKKNKKKLKPDKFFMASMVSHNFTCHMKTTINFFCFKVVFSNVLDAFNRFLI